MSAKITLYSEPYLIDRVKKYAKEHNTSVSKLVTNFFENIVSKENEHKEKNAQKTSKLYGILKNTSEDEYKDYLQKKYL